MNYLRLEGAFRSSVWAELPAYVVANASTETLAWVLQRAGFEAHEGEGRPPASYHRKKALLYLGVIAVRSTRAAMAVLAAGYEAEVNGLKRTLTEAHSRARRVVADESGSYAEQWLLGRAGKPARAVGQFSPDGLWEMMSHSAHADHRGVENFLAITQPDGSTTLLLAPERRVRVSNATLAVFAGETRDVARLIAHEHGLVIPDLELLDEAISAHFPWAGGNPEDAGSVDAAAEDAAERAEEGQ